MWQDYAPNCYFRGELHLFHSKLVSGFSCKVSNVAVPSLVKGNYSITNVWIAGWTFSSKDRYLKGWSNWLEFTAITESFTKNVLGSLTFSTQWIQLIVIFVSGFAPSVWVYILALVMLLSRCSNTAAVISNVCYMPIKPLLRLETET